jgi:uncharacterized membrane-anchored protein
MIKLMKSARSRTVLAGLLGAFTVLSLFKMYKAYIFAYHYVGSMPFNPRPPFYFWLATSVACGLLWIMGILVSYKIAQPGASGDADKQRPRA